MNIADSSKNILGDIIKWRRKLHTIPELGFELSNTSKYVIDRLEEMGIEYKIIAKTGIVATIPGIGNELTVALRADMDGLPIKEETGLPYASLNGCMHACGHDAHVAMLLGAAKILSENRNMLKGNVKLLFQPAEEIGLGAKMMIEEGCLEDPRVNVIFGLHIGNLSAEIENGFIGARSGEMMASMDKFSIKVIGKGGHGAAPEKCVDPIAISAEIISSLQKIVSREIEPVNPVVVTIGKINGGTAFNIIPEEVNIEGTVRTLSSKDRVYVENRIKDMVKYIAMANCAEARVEYINEIPVLMNDEKLTVELIEAAQKIVGNDGIVKLKRPMMTSEDMSCFLEKVPGNFFYLGSNNSEKGIVYPHHNSKFDVDEDVLWIGTAVFVQAVVDSFESR